MPEFIAPEDADDEPPANNDSQQPQPDLPTVEIDGEEVDFHTAADTIGTLISEPEAFGIVTQGETIEMRNEMKELRETVEQQQEAIAELASAVELLSEHQANIAGSDRGATVQLDAQALGGIYTTTLYGADL
jgi:methyl-accepting chemotaxis protein